MVKSLRNGDSSSRAGYKGVNRFWDRHLPICPATSHPGAGFLRSTLTQAISHGRQRSGITDDNLPEGKQNTGRPNIGGSIATAGGLVFIGATDGCSRFRAFDSKTGQENCGSRKLTLSAHSALITFQRQERKTVCRGDRYEGGGFPGR